MTLSLDKLLAIIVWDFRIQTRYYFWHAAAVVTAVWLLLLMALSAEAAVVWIPVLIFGDIGNIGLLFVAGILFLERRQGTLWVSAIMPVSKGLWVAAKLISLTLLCSICAAVIVFFNVDEVSWPRVIIAIILSSALFTSIGFLISLPYDRIMNYFFVMALAMGVLNIPIFAHLEIFDHWLMWVLPTQPALWLLADSLSETATLNFYAVSLLALAWIMLIHWMGTYFLIRKVANS